MLYKTGELSSNDALITWLEVSLLIVAGACGHRQIIRQISLITSGSGVDKEESPAVIFGVAIASAFQFGHNVSHFSADQRRPFVSLEMGPQVCVEGVIDG